MQENIYLGYARSVRPDRQPNISLSGAQLSQQAFYYMTDALLKCSDGAKTRSWQHLPRLARARFLTRPNAFSGPIT